MNDATDYTKAFAAKPQPLTLAEAAQITPPMQLTDTEGMIDVPRMRRYRQNRLREQMKAHGLDAVILTDPLSIRYATGVRNCTLFQMHIHAGYLFIPAEGPVIYFDSEPGRETGAQLETIDEIRDDLMPLSYMFAGYRHQEWCDRWAKKMKGLVEEHCGGGSRVGVERTAPVPHMALEAVGLTLVDAGEALAHARKIKSPEEILCMNQTIAVAEDGMTRMRNALVNGVSEQELWSYLWRANIEAGGEWLDYRLLASGERTNPWQQEASSRIIRAGDMVVFDCGMIGPWSYGCDISRAYHCGPGRPTDEQCRLYQAAHAEIMHNAEMLRPGISFQELIDGRYRQPEGYNDQHYPCMMHGLGMADEYPVLYYPDDGEFHYDGELEPGMVICVESYVGKHGGREGVKLEDQYLITGTGAENLSRYPFEESLLGRKVF